MISQIVSHLRKGHIVIFPTDTVYGIGCSIDSNQALEKLYRIRKTPKTKPSLILVSNINQAEKYGYFSKRDLKLLQKFWPGPLTAVVRAKNLVPDFLQKKGKVAIRLPDQPFLLEIIKEIGFPLAAPSANFPGMKAPFRFKQIDNKLLSLVDYAIDLNDIASARKMSSNPSTLVDLSGKSFKILREGTVSAEKINSYSEIYK